MQAQFGDLKYMGDASGEIAPFAADISRAQNRKQAFDLLAALARGIGFNNLTLSIESSGPTGHQRGARWSTLDSERQTCLDSIGFDGHDPVRRFARRTSDPFIWSRGDWPGDRSPAARNIMINLRKASIEAGMSVAVWGRAGRIAIADGFGYEDRVRALQPIAADIFFLATAQTMRVIDRLSAVQDVPKLTRRETEILELATQGLNVRAIAGRLQIVEATVKFHFKGIRQKLNSRSKAEAIANFASWGVTSDMVSLDESRKTDQVLDLLKNAEMIV